MMAIGSGVIHERRASNLSETVRRSKIGSCPEAWGVEVEVKWWLSNYVQCQGL